MFQTMKLGCDGGMFLIYMWKNFQAFLFYTLEDIMRKLGFLNAPKICFKHVKLDFFL